MTIGVGDVINRRCRREMLTSTELMICNAMDAVESLGAHPLLTDTVILLAEARVRVADWIEKRERKPLYLSNMEPQPGQKASPADKFMPGDFCWHATSNAVGGQKMVVRYIQPSLNSICEQVAVEWIDQHGTPQHYVFLATSLRK